MAPQRSSSAASAALSVGAAIFALLVAIGAFVVVPNTLNKGFKEDDKAYFTCKVEVNVERGFLENAQDLDPAFSLLQLRAKLGQALTIFSANGRDWANTCNENGVLIAPGQCLCDLGYLGVECAEVDDQTATTGKAASDPSGVLLVVDSFGLLNGYDSAAFSNADLAQLVASDRNAGAVTVLYAGPENPQFESVQRNYGEHNVRLVRLPAVNDKAGGNADVAASYQVYRWLRDHNEFSVVHFRDSRGLAYYTLMAVRQQLSCFKAKILVDYREDLPSRRVALQTGFKDILTTDTALLRQDYMYQRSVEMAEAITTADPVLLTQAMQLKWKLPSSIFTVLDSAYTVPPTPKSAAEPAKITELVYIGDLNLAAGLGVFLNAIDHLIVNGEGGRVQRVTFLGQVDAVRGVPSDELIHMRAFGWNIPYSIRSPHQYEIIEFLQASPGRLAVLPSLAAAPSRLAHALLQARLPFLSSYSGDVDQSTLPAAMLTAANSTEHLVHRLEAILLQGVKSGEPTANVASVSAIWQEMYRTLSSNAVFCPSVNIPKTEQTPLVTVVLVHHDRPKLLQQAIASLEAQTFKNFEIVLVDDGSTEPESMEYLNDLSWSWWEEKGWKVLREPNRYLGAARNTGARHAKGKYLLFMDDDDIAKPHQLATYVRVASATKADVVTSGHDLFNGESAPNEASVLRRYVPLGAAVYVGMLENCFGDSNMFVKADAFKALGGFTEDFGVGFEDYEFLAKTVLQGYHLEAVSEPLHWYRAHEDSMSMTTDLKAGQARFLRPYLEVYPVINDLTFQALLRYTRDKFFAHDVQRRFASVLANTTVISTATAVVTSTLQFTETATPTPTSTLSTVTVASPTPTPTPTATGSVAPTPTATGSVAPTPTPTPTLPPLPCPPELIESCGFCTELLISDCAGFCPGDSQYGFIVDCRGLCVPPADALLSDLCGVCGGPCTESIAQAYVDAGAFDGTGLLNPNCSCQDCRGTVNPIFSDDPLIRQPSGLDFCDVCYGGNNLSECFVLAKLAPAAVPFQPVTSTYLFAAIGAGFSVADQTFVNNSQIGVTTAFIAPGRLNNIWLTAQPALNTAAVENNRPYSVFVSGANGNTSSLTLSVYTNAAFLTFIKMNGVLSPSQPTIAVTTVNSVGDEISIGGSNLTDLTTISTPTCFIQYQPGTKVGQPGFQLATSSLEYVKVTAQWNATVSEYGCAFPTFNVSQEVVVSFAYGDVFSPAFLLPVFNAAALKVQVFALAPQLQSARYSDNCAAILVDFDVGTTAAAGPAPCSAYMDTVGDPAQNIASLGNDGDCLVTFSTPNQMHIFVSSRFLDDPFVIPATIPVVGSSIRFRDNVLGRRGAAFSNTVSGIATLAAPTRTPAPLIAIEAPQFVGPCNSFTLLTVSTQRTGGRNAALVTYTLDENLIASTASPDRVPMIVAGVNAILSTATQNSLMAFSIPSSLLDTGVRYRFTVTVINFCGGTATRTHEMVVLNIGIPTVVGSPINQQFVYQPTVLNTAIEDPCQQFDVDTAFNLRWTGFIPSLNAPFVFSNRAAVTSSLLQLPEYSLNVSTTYQFFLTVTNNATGHEFTLTNEVRTVPALSLDVFVEGGVRTQRSILTPAVLSVKIADLDIANGPTAADLVTLYQYRWTCLQAGLPCRSAQNGEVLLFASTPSITVSLEQVALPRETLTFFVNVRKLSTGSEGSASQTLDILSAASATAGNSVFCAENLVRLSTIDELTIVCSADTAFAVNISSVDAVGTREYYQMLLNGATVAVPASFSSLSPTSITSASSVAPINGKFQAVFKTAPGVLLAGRQYAFRLTVRPLAADPAAALSQHFVVRIRQGLTPTGQCIRTSELPATPLAYETIFSYICKNTETDMSAYPVLTRLRTSLAATGARSITLAFPSAAVETYLPGGFNRISVQYTDSLRDRQISDIENITVLEASQTTFDTSVTDSLDRFDTNKYASDLIKNLIVFSLTPLFQTVTIPTMTRIVSSLLLAFPNPDFQVIGPSVTVILSALSETYFLAALGDPSRRRSELDPTVTFAVQAMCAAASTTDSMNADAKPSETCFGEDTLSNLAETVGRLAAATGSLGNMTVPWVDLASCYATIVSRACECQQRLLTPGQRFITVDGLEFQLSCGLFNTRSNVALCAGTGDFVASLPVGTLPTTLGAACAVLDNSVFGRLTTNTTQFPYVSSIVVGLTITQPSGPEVVFNDSNPATFLFPLPMDNRVREYVALNSSQTSNFFGVVKLLCGYYDVERNYFDTVGCATLAVQADNVLCNCSHTTDYSIIVEAVPQSSTQVDTNIPTAFLTLFLVLAVILTAILAVLGFIFLRRSQKRVEVEIMPVVAPEQPTPAGSEEAAESVDVERLKVPGYVAPPSYADHLATAALMRRIAKGYGSTRSNATARINDDDDEDDDEDDDYGSDGDDDEGEEPEDDDDEEEDEEEEEEEEEEEDDGNNREASPPADETVRTILQQRQQKKEEGEERRRASSGAQVETDDAGPA